MPKIKFWKMSGAGNDFVLLRGGGRPTAALRRLAVRLCAIKTGIGADGLLALEVTGRSSAGVRYFNSDGSEAFCGNGTRCAAWWLHAAAGGGKRLALLTPAGKLDAEIAGPGRVRLAMPPVKSALLNFKGKFPGGIKTLHFLDTGVPHAVVPVKDVAAVDVAGLGRRLRFNKAFGPGGTNVNFVQVRAGRALVRTYERGVEAETRACGTGVTACAVALALTGALRPPVSAQTRGNDVFRVWLRAGRDGADKIRLQGPARIVFEGEVES